jgi:DNA end-binding protein Ku
MQPMPRSVWRGTLSFGLVAIPVSLYPATEAKDVRFHLFDREGRRVRYKRVVEADLPLGEPEEDEVEDDAASSHATEPTGDESGPGVEVAYEDLVRGYEVEPETYVFLETEEIERARPSPSRVIDLEHFVRLEEIDPVYFEKAYYVAPAPGAERSYGLLLRTMKETGRVGIGRFVLRTKPHLVALRPMDEILALETLFFGDEVRDAAPLVGRVGGAAVTQREIDISKQLVEALATEWEPSRFADEYREELMRMISERAPERIEEPREEASEDAGWRMGELMDALKRSVDEAKAGRKPGGRRAG